jgi:hypothetical protein
MSGLPSEATQKPTSLNRRFAQKLTLATSLASQGNAKAYFATSHPQLTQIIVRWSIRMIHPGFDALFLQFSVFRRSVEVETYKHRQRQDYTHNGASH